MQNWSYRASAQMRAGANSRIAKTPTCRLILLLVRRADSCSSMKKTSKYFIILLQGRDGFEHQTRRPALQVYSWAKGFRIKRAPKTALRCKGSFQGSSLLPAVLRQDRDLCSGLSLNPGAGSGLQPSQIIGVEKALRRYHAFLCQEELVRLSLVSPDGKQLFRRRPELGLIGILVVQLYTCRIAVLFVTRQGVR